MEIRHEWQGPNGLPHRLDVDEQKAILAVLRVKRWLKVKKPDTISQETWDYLIVLRDVIEQLNLTGKLRFRIALFWNQQRKGNFLQVVFEGKDFLEFVSSRTRI